MESKGVEEKGPTESKELPPHTVDSPHAGEPDLEHGTHKQAALSRGLQGRHMQMIAIGEWWWTAPWGMANIIPLTFFLSTGGSIGAGLFVSSGGSLQSGGPASLVLGFMIIGAMLLCTVQALGELAVLYPVNGAFFNYGVRFIDPAW